MYRVVFSTSYYDSPVGVRPPGGYEDYFKKFGVGRIRVRRKKQPGDIGMNGGTKRYIATSKDPFVIVIITTAWGFNRNKHGDVTVLRAHEQ